MTGGIGDALLGIPFLSVFKDFQPEITIYVLATKPNMEVLFSRPEISKFVLFPEHRDLRSLIRLGRRLRGIEFDLMVGLLPTNLRSHSLLAKALGAPMRLKHKHPRAYENEAFQFWYTDLVRINDGEHTVFSNLALLRPLGIDISGLTATDIQSRLRIPLTKDEQRKALQESPRSSSPSLRVGFHAGAGVGWEFKRWDPDKFAQLAMLIGHEFNAEIFWFGGDGEVGLVEGIMANMTYPSRSFAGRLRLRETAAVIAGCDLFISNVSGLMHVATAVEVESRNVWARSITSMGPKTVPHNPQQMMHPKLFPSDSRA